MILVAARNPDGTATVFGWIISATESMCYNVSHIYKIPRFKEVTYAVSAEMANDSRLRLLASIEMEFEKVMYMHKERLMLIAKPEDVAEIKRCRNYQPLDICELTTVILR